MRVIAVANQKGGCGKTTTSINLSAALAMLHKKVLIVDLDPQGHSTCGLGLDARKLSYSLYDLLCLREDLKPAYARVLHEINNSLFIVPAYEILSALEEELIHIPDREKRLKNILKELARSEWDFDYAVIDCPPNLGILTYNAFEAADEVVIPIEPSFFSLHGLAKISETISIFNQRRIKPLEVHALLTMFDSRTRFAKDIFDEVKTYFGESLFKTIIHESIALREAAGAGKSVVDYDPESTGFRDYFNLAVEYLERDWDRKLPESELGWDQTVHQRFGPKRVAGGILFQAQFKSVKGVEVVGDFNHWIPEPMIRRDLEGLWQKVIPMQRGTYRYKLIVDGEWQMDPFQPVQRANSFGTHDSYLEVR